MDWMVLAGSLLGILLTVGLVKLLRMGDGGLDGESAAMTLAEQTSSGFVATDAICGGDHGAALVAGAAGDFVLLKRLGSHYSGRHLIAPVTARQDDATLRIDSGDRWFGVVALTLSDASVAGAWRDRLSGSSNRLAA